ncbi:low affinity iron permease family protein [Sphingomonas abietis]|uniref:Low affinity iron permease family protein n=1 Tax=Sphingomonas abietis TaxID=3012344 RepID=A0ABY7NIF7_9SPHN|nr:low affinity iron permease family protein [Sphingomonas abietis]WBO21311.1 low affinity iron permease family protein [Sphingomonas abietis]
MDRFFTKMAGGMAAFAGQPLAFVIALALIMIWAVTGPIFHYSDTWQLVVNTATTIVTFLMVFLIQNSQNRDGAAMQAKLDELIRALDNARGTFIGIEHLTDRQIAEIRAALEADCKKEPEKYEGKRATVTNSVDRLLSRY